MTSCLSFGMMACSLSIYWSVLSPIFCILVLIFNTTVITLCSYQHLVVFNFACLVIVKNKKLSCLEAERFRRAGYWSQVSQSRLPHLHGHLLSVARLIG